MVLGKFIQDGKSYVKVAAHYRASYFKLKNWGKITKGMTEDQIWKINKAFMDQQIKAGKHIILSQDPSKASNFYLKEINYLKALSFRFVKDGWVWKAIK